MKPSLSTILVLAISGPVLGKTTAAPIAPGVYCLKEPTYGYTGTGTDIALGDFIASVVIYRTKGRYVITIANQMPDNSQILEIETANARVLRDGSLAFNFVDNWENEGRGRIYPNDKVALEMTKQDDAPGNQIGRNYGTFRVSKSGCEADIFRQLR